MRLGVAIGACAKKLDYAVPLSMTQTCSGITSGRVLSGELYAQRLQKLVYLHLLTGCFMKISLQSFD